jgi:pimeloyl-ACP methyl ester carboxylesterase
MALISPPAGRVEGHDGERPMPQVAGVDHSWRYVHLGTDKAVRLHVAQAGSGPVVLLLHGFAQHWYAWREVIPLLAEDYRLVCVDTRGFGWSEQTKRGYDTESLAADVLALMDELGLTRVRLIAHDWGAGVGFRACLRAPDRFTGFLAINASHPWPQHRRVLPNLWRMWFTALVEYPVLGRLVLRHFPGFTRFLLRYGVAEPNQWQEDDLAEFVAATQHSAHPGQSLMWQYVVRDIPALIRGSLKGLRLKVPTVILAGAEDPVIPPSLLAGGERHADDLTVHVLAGAGHHLPDELPIRVAQEARQLFDRLA